MKIREGGSKACDPVTSQPELTDVDLRRMSKAKEEMSGCVLVFTAIFGVR